MEFGQVINPDYDPSKNHIYKEFYNYFDNPVITKTKDVMEYTVYMTKIYSLLGNAFRYLILFVTKDDNSIGTEKKMDTIEWISLQTRTLEEHHNLKKHSYNNKKTSDLKQKINVVNRDTTKSTYNAETYPLIITLLHTRKNNTYQYQPTGTIDSALETFQTIITFK